VIETGAPNSAQPPAWAEDERWKLVQRVAASDQFRRAPRLRDFLLYVSERILSSPGVEIGEYEISQEVFKRPQSFSPAEDSIVRSSARQLRAKLHEYFEAAGSDEKQIVEIPKGSYAPVFSPRTVPAIPPEPRGTRGLIQRIGMWQLAVILLLSMALVLVAVRDRRAAISAPAPNLISWALAGNQPLNVVLCDSALVVVNSFRPRMITLNEYISAQEQKMLPLPPGNPLGATPPEFPGRRLITSFRDLTIVERLGELGAKAGFRSQIRHARLMQVRDFRDGNGLIIGSPWSNPWASLFQDRLNFHFAQLPDGQFGITNQSPQPGERGFYTCRPEQARNGTSHAVVALTKNLSANGLVLIVAGLHTESSEGATDAVLSPAFLRSLHTLVGGRSPADLAGMELLLEVTATDGVVSQTKLVAHRLP